MKKYMSVILLLILLSVSYVTSAQTMPDYVIRTAQEINAIYGEGTIDINSTGWDWRGGSIGDNFPLTEGCNSPITLPASTTATGYYRVFFDTNIDGIDEWRVVVYSDYSYFGLCTAPVYSCGLLEPRLTVGSLGHVDPDGFPNNLRAQPGESGQLTGEIPAGGEFSIIDGPRCASNISFWLVNYNSAQGWTAEGRDQEYFLVPGVIPTGLVVNPTPVVGPTAIPTPATVPLFTCGGVTSRLSVGRTAQVTPGLPNNLRALPGESGQYLGEIPPGFPFEIVGGPECNSNLIWWQVNYQGTIGWTGEAGSADDYWLEPISFDVPPISPSSVNTLVSYATLTPQVLDVPLATYINARNEVISVWSNHEAIWRPSDPTKGIPDIIWSAPIERQLTNPPLATRLDAGSQMVRLVRNLANNQLVSLEGGTFFDDYDLSLDNNTIDIAAFHPDDGDMVILSQRGLGFILVNANPDSPTYRQVSQSGRVMSPTEIYTKLTFSANGQRMVGLTDASNLMVWRGLSADPATWTAAFPILLANDIELSDVALNPDGTKLVITGMRNAPNSTQKQGFHTLYNLTDTNATEASTTYFGLDTPVSAVEFIPDGSMFVLASSPTDLLIVDTTTTNQLRLVTGLTEQVTDITFNADATLMATTSATGTVTMWRAN